MLPAGRGQPSAGNASLSSNVINRTWAKSSSEQLRPLGWKFHPGQLSPCGHVEKQRTAEKTTAAGQDKVWCDVKAFSNKSAVLVSLFKSEWVWDHSSNCAHAGDSASRDNWVSAALCAGCLRTSPSAAPSQP